MLIIADGPRPDRPDDVALCHAARGVVDDIDWPCRIEWNSSVDNLGCDRRITTGLDWAFGLVDRAIILEDDTLPTEDFFAWAELMLDRHEGSETIGMVCGNNPLAVWGDPSRDMILARRGSIWGWATWANAWRRTMEANLAGDPASAHDEISRLGLDPFLAQHLSVYLETWRQGRLSAWCVTLSVKMALLGQRAVISPVNLIRNCGIGPEATRTTFADDFSSQTPVFAARLLAEPTTMPPGTDDASFDRASVLVELMRSCANPMMAIRLARALAGEAARGTTLPIEPRMRHHLLPFQNPGESLVLLNHLQSHGLRTHQVDRIAGALRAAIPETVS
jgi:hypothetical protein